MNPLRLTGPPARMAHMLWRYEPVQPGRDAVGQVAGPVVHTATHWAGKTVPCLGYGCPLCERQSEQRYTGYLGLLDGGRRLLLPLAAETVRHAAELLVPGMLVRLSRPPGGRKPLRVTAMRPDPMPCEPVDLWPALLWMWRRHIPTAAALPSTLAPQAAGSDNYVALASESDSAAVSRQNPPAGAGTSAVHSRRTGGESGQPWSIDEQLDILAGQFGVPK
jgi:hypothetical protein